MWAHTRTHTHSEIGFQLHSIPTARRKVRETQGEKVSALVLFEQTVDRSAVASLCTIQLHERANTVPVVVGGFDG